MSQFTDQDLLRYLEGDTTDAQETEQIRAALNNDPELTGRCEQLRASLQPSSEGMDYVQGMLQALEASIWARLQFSEPFGSSGPPRRAKVQAPNVQDLSVDVESTERVIRLHIPGLPDGWRVASVALLHAVAPPWNPLELVVGPKVERSERARSGRQSPRSPVAHSAALRDERPAWTSEVVKNRQGVKIWLENASITLRVDSPAGSAPLGKVRYRFARIDPKTSDVQQPTGLLDLHPAGKRILSGQLPLGLKQTDLGNLSWRVTVEPAGPQDVPHLTADQLRAVVGDDFQTLILTPAANDRWEAPFHNPYQRALWSDPTALQMLRIEPR